MDYAGIALIITACGTFLTAGGTLWVALRQQNMSIRLDETHKLVNGMSHELQDADKKAAGAEGFIAGNAGEKYQSPAVPATKSE